MRLAGLVFKLWSVQQISDSIRKFIVGIRNYWLFYFFLYNTTSKTRNGQLKLKDCTYHY